MKIQKPLILKFKNYLRTYLRQLKKIGVPRPRIGKSVLNSARIELRRKYEADILKMIPSYTDTSGTWKPVMLEPEIFQGLDEPEDRVHRWENFIYGYCDMPCFWPYLLSPNVIPRYTAQELEGYGAKKIICPTWLKSVIGSPDPSENKPFKKNKSFLRFEEKLAIHFQTNELQSANKEVKKLWTIMDLNMGRLLPYLNLNLKDSDDGFVQLAQFHLGFEKKVYGQIDDKDFKFIDSDVALKIMDEIEFYEDYLAGKIKKSRNIEVRLEKFNHPISLDEMLIYGFVDVMFRFFALETYIDFKQQGEEADKLIHVETPSNLLLLHKSLQDFLKESLLGQKNNKLDCRFHKNNQNQFCCHLTAEANKLLEIINTETYGLRLVEQERENSSIKLYFIGSIEKFITH